jgi:hypothetical protein
MPRGKRQSRKQYFDDSELFSLPSLPSRSRSRSRSPFFSSLTNKDIVESTYNLPTVRATILPQLSSYATLKTTELPQPYTPDEIIETITQAIHTVEGPTSYHLLRPTEKLEAALGRQGSVMLLLGDVHQGKIHCDVECKPQNNCFSTYRDRDFSLLKFIDNTLAPFVTTDLFLEMWSDQYNLFNRLGSRSIYGLNFDSSLIDVIDDLEPCTVWDKRTKTKPFELMCPVNNIRVHKTDVRAMLSLAGDPNEEKAYFYKNAEFVLLWALISLNEYNQPATTTDFEELVNDNFQSLNSNGGERWKELLMLILKRIEMGSLLFFQTYYRQHPLFRKNSRVYKELEQLPLSLIDEMFANASLLFPSYDDDPSVQPMPQIVEDFYDQVAQRHPTKDELLPILREVFHKHVQQSFELHWTNFISEFDLYFLSRSLKSPEDGLPSQLSILYVGDLHVQQIVKFLLQTGWYECISHKRVPYSFEESVNKPKCIKNIRAHLHTHS